MDGIALRRFSLAGKLYAQGDAVTLPDDQFSDLADSGLVEPAPVQPAPKVSKWKPVKSAD